MAIHVIACFTGYWTIFGPSEFWQYLVHILRTCTYHIDPFVWFLHSLIITQTSGLCNPTVTFHISHSRRECSAKQNFGKLINSSPAVFIFYVRIAPPLLRTDSEALPLLTKLKKCNFSLKNHQFLWSLTCAWNTPSTPWLRQQRCSLEKFFRKSQTVRRTSLDNIQVNSDKHRKFRHVFT